MSNIDEVVGKEIKGYKIIRPIGQGKFSVVFKGERLADKQMVALKLIKVKERREKIDFWYDGPETERKMSKRSETSTGIWISKRLASEPSSCDKISGFLHQW